MSLAAVGALAAVLCFASVAYVLALAFAALTVGAPLARVVIGTGPALFSRAIGSVTWVMRVLPFGGYIEPKKDAEGNDTLFPPLHRAAIALSPPLTLILVSFVCGAPPSGVTHAFVQVVEGALSPVQVGAVLVRAWSALVAAEPARAVGALLMRLALFNLLPVPGLGGFDVLDGLTRAATGWRGERPRWLGLVGLACVLPITVGWIIALARS